MTLLCFPVHQLRIKAIFLFPRNSVSIYFIWWSEKTKILASNNIKNKGLGGWGSGGVRELLRNRKGRCLQIALPMPLQSCFTVLLLAPHGKEPLHQGEGCPDQCGTDNHSEIKLPTSAGSSKKQESSRKTSISALLTMTKPLTVWITINCGKFWRSWEYQTTWPAPWETYMQVRKQQLELDMEQQTGSK